MEVLMLRFINVRKEVTHLSVKNLEQAKTYKDALNLHTLKELSGFATSWGVEGRSKLNKEALIMRIIETIEEGLTSVYLTFNSGHILAMRHSESLPLDSNFHTQEIKELITLGLLLKGKDQFYVYDKWDTCIEALNETYPGAIENNTFVKLSIETIIVYRGLVAKDEAIKIIGKLSDMAMPESMIEMILDYTIGRTRNVYETDGYFHDHRITEIDKRLEFLSTSMVSKVYEITLQDMIYYSENQHMYKGPGFEMFSDVLMPKYLTNKFEVVDLMDQLNLMIIYGYKPSDYMRMVASNLNVTDGKALKTLADACMVFYNEMPQWLINGYSPNALNGKMKAPIKKEEKISRNAPCPCGSGKKYKHCCLN